MGVRDSFASEGSEGNKELLLYAPGTPIEQVCSSISEDFWPKVCRELQISHEASRDDF
jgi:hypothetical protein